MARNIALRPRHAAACAILLLGAACAIALSSSTAMALAVMNPTVEQPHRSDKRVGDTRTFDRQGKWEKSEEENCEDINAQLRTRKAVLCDGFDFPRAWCGPAWDNVTAHHDWPSQATYMQDLLSYLQSAPTACLNDTNSVAPHLVNTFMNVDMASATAPKSFMHVYTVFQFQYYDMPRKAGERIESPWTLGMKCWAFAYLTEFWSPIAMRNALAAAGLAMNAFSRAYSAAGAESLTLCQQVINNCFVNASYDPSRRGSCPLSVDEFKMAFDFQNLKHGDLVKYPFS